MPVMEGFPDIPSSHLFRQDMADGPPSGYEPCQVRKARKQEGIFWKGDILGGGNSNIFIFTQKNGEMIQFDEHIFQMGGSTTN